MNCQSKVFHLWVSRFGNDFFGEKLLPKKPKLKSLNFGLWKICHFFERVRFWKFTEGLDFRETFCEFGASLFWTSVFFFKVPHFWDVEEKVSGIPLLCQAFKKNVIFGFWNSCHKKETWFLGELVMLFNSTKKSLSYICESFTFFSCSSKKCCFLCDVWLFSKKSLFERKRDETNVIPRFRVAITCFSRIVTIRWHEWEL